MTAAQAGVLLTAFPQPAVPERQLILDRLNGTHRLSLQNIRQEDSTDFFGDYSHPFMADLDKMALAINNILSLLIDDI